MKKFTAAMALLLSVLILGTLVGLAFAQGDAPIAENLELTTYRGVSVGGRLSAIDPDSEALTYQITTDPVKGSIDLDADGHFVYTPENGKRGKDYFGYRATDASGNRSQEATVIIRIEKQQSAVTYADLDGRGEAYAAVRLAEADIFTGENLAGAYVFSPDAPVSRSEFLAMCMKVADIAPCAELRSTGFADDSAISAWAKPYVGAALQSGVISGYESEAGVCFCPDQSICPAEAAVMLDRAAGLTDAVSVWAAENPALPVWAAASAAKLGACDLLPYGCSFSDPVLTRGQAAEMLSGLIDVLNRR